MTFNSSCSYCCVANLLKLRGIDVSDRELALAAGIPYRLRRDPESGSFATGAMLQRPEDFDRALRLFGLRFCEEFVAKQDTPAFLAAHAPCMVGLAREPSADGKDSGSGTGGKHAMVCTGGAGGNCFHRAGTTSASGEKSCGAGDVLTFLNPHRKGDGEPDFVQLSHTETLARLRGTNAVGWLFECSSAPAKPEQGSSRSLQSAPQNASQETLKLYRAELHTFLSAKQTRQSLLENRDRLLRPLALDLPEALRLVGDAGKAKSRAARKAESGAAEAALVVESTGAAEAALTAELARLQQAVFMLFTQAECVPFDIVCAELLDTCLDDWGELMGQHAI